MADIGSSAVASTHAGSRILRMFTSLSRDARQWAAEGSPCLRAPSITAVTVSAHQPRIGLRVPRLDLVALGPQTGCGGTRGYRGQTVPEPRTICNRKTV